MIFDINELGDAGNNPTDWTFYFDDITLVPPGGGGGGSEPSVAAPTPTRDPANVISLFSDAYTDVPVDTFLAGTSV